MISVRIYTEIIERVIRAQTLFGTIAELESITGDFLALCFPSKYIVSIYQYGHNSEF